MAVVEIQLIVIYNMFLENANLFFLVFFIVFLLFTAIGSQLLIHRDK